MVKVSSEIHVQLDPAILNSQGKLNMVRNRDSLK